MSAGYKFSGETLAFKSCIFAPRNDRQRNHSTCARTMTCVGMAQMLGMACAAVAAGRALAITYGVKLWALGRRGENRIISVLIEGFLAEFFS